MTRAEILDGVTSILQESLQVSADAITPASSLAADLGADSLDVMDIVVRLNRRFSLRLSARELGEQLRTGQVAGVTMPDATAFSSDPDDPDQIENARKIADLLTVDFLVNAVEAYQKIETQSA
jgi:acyl carrier protein